jgi:hypothetical protein
MPGNAVANFPRQIEALPIVFENIDDAQALIVVIEATRHERTQYSLARVTEWRVPQIVAQRNGFGELFVEPQHLGDGARDLRDLERVRQASPIVIARG